jgi:hypothetical protein
MSAAAAYIRAGVILLLGHLSDLCLRLCTLHSALGSPPGARQTFINLQVSDWPPPLLPQGHRTLAALWNVRRVGSHDIILRPQRAVRFGRIPPYEGVRVLPVASGRRADQGGTPSPQSFSFSALELISS